MKSERLGGLPERSVACSLHDRHDRLPDQTRRTGHVTLSRHGWVNFMGLTVYVDPETPEGWTLRLLRLLKEGHKMWTLRLYILRCGP